MTETGRATAPAAGTVLNALATHRGAAFAIDVETTATVERRERANGITGAIEGDADADTALIERCVELVVETTGADLAGAHVETESDVPTAAGLKSSSAAANAAVLATLDLLGERMEPADAARLGVRAAREAGVTVTGAFDDAGASMLGGLVVTDNDDDELLKRDAVDWDVLVWTPGERAYSADADVERCERIAPMADLALDLAMEGDYGRAMTVNGLAFSAALSFPTEPAVEAMPHAAGVSLSGTGPSVLAVGERAALEPVAERWRARDGRTWFTRTRTEGARQG